VTARRRLRRLGAAAAGGLLAGGLLAACGSSAALGLVRAACGHVDQSIRTYEASLRLPPGPAQEALQRTAALQLEAAQRKAAVAAGEDAEWQALMTTISESPRIPEGYLVHALEEQCQVASSPGGQDAFGNLGTQQGAPPPASAVTLPGDQPANGVSSARSSRASSAGRSAPGTAPAASSPGSSASS
jgi:hypothetical protein